MSKPDFVYVIYIASTPEKVFEALTDARMSERYWHGNYVESDWKVGSPFALRLTRRDKAVTGKVLEYDPPRRLAYTFRSAEDGHASEKPSRVTFELERQRDQVKLTVVHDEFEPGSKVLEKISRGWPLILSSLKSFVENGTVLHAPWQDEQAAKSEQPAGAK
jgi:uncharacterized protein YndB with AHSA1/START domain